ncbi:D-isomer specific 2-hydroxyacid dehydrogenase [Microdochium trichocladiopsis]|uniref:D-isomer specific 2-hydroxyacid dehydrogenase n=1 Tax=Microdochium trichocladiopsis TaxID=1682393 RepID=A0A9P8Y099_9PEZI|nr:D-isomer specific 2-hydroxyacid dehydrogenase [Microdochium trichocladiopsis]KAH7025651.1 D-isomer specific 2-hydroxyacid dehydrogenase [Microdochium trichocladiopsis]
MANSPIPEARSVPQNDVLFIFIPYDIPHKWVQDVQSHRPGLEVRWHNSMNADKSLIPVESIDPALWQGVTLLCTYVPPPADLIPLVRFVQLASAGSDLWYSHPSFRKQDVTFCTANGIHPPQIAEWVIGSWLSYQHHLAKYLRDMNYGRWENLYESPVEESRGKRMGILGYGAIGREVTRLATALGMQVVCYTRNQRTTLPSRRDSSFCVPGTGDPDGLLPVAWFSGTDKESVNYFLDQSLDILVIWLPLTHETRHIFAYKQSQILGKHKTFLCNVGRGGHVDHGALLDALQTGLIPGAAIDVTDPEPLPKDHSLWNAPRLLITPHVSWKSNAYWPRVLDLLAQNLRNLEEQKTPLNLVNRDIH